jgi:hypothetical protein
MAMGLNGNSSPTHLGAKQIKIIQGSQIIKKAGLPHNQEGWAPTYSGPEGWLPQNILGSHTSQEAWRNSRSSLSSLGRKLPHYSGPEGWLPQKGGGEERRQGHSAIVALVLGLVLHLDLCLDLFLDLFLDIFLDYWLCSARGSSSGRSRHVLISY